MQTSSLAGLSMRRSEFVLFLITLSLLAGSMLVPFVAQDQAYHHFADQRSMLGIGNAVDGHAKNFSLFHEHGGTYRMTPLYDVLSAWPVIGRGANQLSRQDVSMAMAWRTTNAHYRRNEIQRRHFDEVAMRLGIGRDAEEIVEELLAATPGVIAEVEGVLPKEFPGDVAERIFRGLGDSVRVLKG